MVHPPSQHLYVTPVQQSINTLLRCRGPHTHPPSDAAPAAPALATLRASRSSKRSPASCPSLALTCSGAVGEWCELGKQEDKSQVTGKARII